MLGKEGEDERIDYNTTVIINNRVQYRRSRPFMSVSQLARVLRWLVIAILYMLVASVEKRTLFDRNPSWLVGRIEKDQWAWTDGA